LTASGLIILCTSLPDGRVRLVTSGIYPPTDG
jgi:hypothetical protein